MLHGKNVRSWRTVMAVASCTALGACIPPPPVADLTSTNQPAQCPDCQLLLLPEPDAASLLGRSVQRSPDGALTIADARAPGCDVNVTREPNTFHASRTLSAHSMTSFAGGYAKLLSLEAKFGRESNFHVEVDNTVTLTGNLAGACGDLVVDKVFVGRGHRRAVASVQAGGGAQVAVGPVQAAPAVDTGQSRDDAVDWSDDQAYAFTVRENAQNAKTEPLRMQVSVPSILDEGDEVEVQFESRRPAWLVVYYVDGTGHAEVLWPSNEEPEPYVAPGQPAVLPSARERAKGFHFKAALLKPGEPSRETLVVYGFSDKRDFDIRKPSAGAENADGASYAAALTKDLQDVPMNRWSRTVVGYVIQPKP